MLAVASCAITAAASSLNTQYPEVQAAEDHSFALFNSIHSAVRQFGSSVHHNGMSFYLAQAPRGSIFYHGDYRPAIPPDFEWMSFEVEHAYAFAESWEPPPKDNLSSSFTANSLLWHQMDRRMSRQRPVADRLAQKSSAQSPIFGASDEPEKDPRPGPYWPDWSKPARGYFHTYMANRPLNLLYIDGEAAAKCTLGSLDSQDHILLDWDPDERRGGGPAEMKRATELCALAQDWPFDAGGKIDGFIRMEAGFEIIYCDFSDGLDQLSVQATPFRNETGAGLDPGGNAGLTRPFEWLRAAAARFHGHPAGRLDVDWSSMVSAFAYPINLTNEDLGRQDLPRVIQATRDDWRTIRGRLRAVVAQRGGRRAGADKAVVAWQAVVDKIVTRFSQRLRWLAADAAERAELLPVIATLVDPFVDYRDRGPDAERLAVDRCAEHYVGAQAVRRASWTPEDRAIAAAVGAVLRTICTSLFSARAVLRSTPATAASGGQDAAEEARDILRQLVADLRWST